MDKEVLEKRITEYEQQAEIMLANFHRLKGAVVALKEVLDLLSTAEATKE